MGGRYSGLNLSSSRYLELSSLLRLLVAVLCGHEELSLACVFKHCGLKTGDFKLLKS